MASWAHCRKKAIVVPVWLGIGGEAGADIFFSFRLVSITKLWPGLLAHHFGALARGRISSIRRRYRVR